MYAPHDRSWLQILFFLWAAICLLQHTASGQFEGVVASCNRTTDETGVLHEFNMTMWIKDQMVKIEISEIGDSPGSTVIYRSDIGRIWILNDEDSTYFEVKKLAGVPDSIHHQTRPGESAIRKTGKRKSILGYPSEQFLMRSGGTETEIWGTTELMGLSAAIAKGLGEDLLSSGSWTDELARSGVFPLVAVTRAGSGIWESSEVTEILRKNLPKSFFTLPPGYSKQRVKRYLSDE
jgi:hypothetical protein